MALSPFPLEDAEQESDLRPRWDPWKGPDSPSWYSGLLTAVPRGLGSGAAKIEGAVGAGLSPLDDVPKDSLFSGPMPSSNIIPFPSDELVSPEQKRQNAEFKLGETIHSDARDRIASITPNPGDQGTAARILSSVTEGAYMLSTGALLGGAPAAATTVGSGYSVNRYDELREQGVDQATATKSGLLAGATSAAGAYLPAAYGVTLLGRLVTGAASNTAFGAANRFADHKILEAGGYQEMADQQRVLDGTQILVDLALGATFGGIHHLLTPAEKVQANRLNTPEAHDAALTMNLSLRDRQAAPGVPVDPEAAGRHQAALQTALEQVEQNKPVDVSESKVGESGFLARPARDLTPEEGLFYQSILDSGLFHEEAKLEDLQQALTERRGAPERETAAPDLTDRLANDDDLRSALTRMKDEAGWQTIGGKGLQNAEGDNVGRTVWEPRAPWWPGRPGGYNEAETRAIVDKALAGKRLGKIQQALIEHMVEHVDHPEVAMGAAPPQEEVPIGEDVRATDHEPAPKEEQNPTQVALEDHPTMAIPDQNGAPRPAAEALAQAKEQASVASAEIPKAIDAAVSCFARRGG